MIGIIVPYVARNVRMEAGGETWGRSGTGGVQKAPTYMDIDP
jgi:hypothetical protein